MHRMADAIPQFTSLHLITGFLGSGKTTLLQRMLAHPALADTAVLINEFGEVGLDHHLLDRIDERTVLLQSGCLCCTIRGELSDALRDLQSRRERRAIPGFRRVIVESTGLADPFPVLTTLHADPVLKHHFRVGRIVTTVDAVNGMATLAAHAESMKQVAVADTLVITKSDIAGPGQAADLRARICTINPAASLFDATDPDLDPEALLSGGPFEPSARGSEVRAWFAQEMHRQDGHGHRHSGDRNRHGSDIRAMALTFDRPLDWTMFGVWLTMLLNRHGASVLRVKGILDVDGVAAPVAVHGVQHLVHAPVHLSGWPDADRRSRIVFILKGLDPAAIEASLTGFMASTGRAATVAA